MNWGAFTPVNSPDCAGLLAVARSTGRVLLLQRPEGTWEAPGGHAEALESPRATALREFGEETGYRGPLRLLPASVQSGPRYRAFGATVPDEFEPRLSEHQSARWVRPAKLPRGTHPGVRGALRELELA